MEARNTVIDCGDLISKIDALPNESCSNDYLFDIESIVSLQTLKALVFGLKIDYPASLTNLKYFLQNRYQFLREMRFMDRHHWNSQVNQACLAVARFFLENKLPEPIFKDYDSLDQSYKAIEGDKLAKVKSLFGLDDDTGEKNEKAVFNFLKQYLVLTPCTNNIVDSLPKTHWKKLIDGLILNIPSRELFVKFMAHQFSKDNWESFLYGIKKQHLYIHIFGKDEIIAICTKYQNNRGGFDKALLTYAGDKLKSLADLRIPHDNYKNILEIKALFFTLISIYQEVRPEKTTYDSVPTFFGDYIPEFVLPYSRDDKLAAAAVFKKFVLESDAHTDLQAELIEEGGAKFKGAITQEGSVLGGLHELHKAMVSQVRGDVGYRHPRSFR